MKKLIYLVVLLFISTISFSQEKSVKTSKALKTMLPPVTKVQTYPFNIKTGYPLDVKRIDNSYGMPVYVPSGKDVPYMPVYVPDTDTHFFLLNAIRPHIQIRTYNFTEEEQKEGKPKYPPKDTDVKKKKPLPIYFYK